MGHAYLHAASASSFRVYQRCKYRGRVPNLPLWQAQVFEKNETNTNVNAVRIGDQWNWHTVTCGSFLRDTSTTHMVTYAHGDWTKVDGTLRAWSGGSTTSGADDGEVSGNSSNTFARTAATVGTETNQPYAEIEFTISSSWNGAVVDISVPVATTGFMSVGDARIDLYDKVGSTYYKIPLNGRGVCIPQAPATDTNLELTTYRGVRYWDSRGVIDGSGANNKNINIEIARGLVPGRTYRIRITKLVDDTAQIAVGRVRIRNEDPYIVPGDSGWRSHMLELAYTTNADPAVANLPGGYTSGWMSSLLCECRITDDASGTFTMGPGYGYQRQTSQVWTGDGNVLSPSSGNVYGPYALLTWVNSEDLMRSVATTNNTNGDAGAGGSVLTVAGATLTAAMVGGCIKITGETGGLDSTAWYPITAIDNTAKTVTVTGTISAGSGKTWAIHEKWCTMVTTHTFANDKMNVSCTLTYAQSRTISRLYWCPFKAATIQNSGVLTARPIHPTDVSPYRCTKISYVPYEFGFPSRDYFLNSPAENGAGTESVADSVDMNDVGVICKRRLFYYDDIEGASMRNIGRIIVFDTDYDTWAGQHNYLTAGIGSWHTNGDSHKSYVTAAASLAVTAGQTTTLTFDSYVTERLWFDSADALLSLGNSSHNPRH